MANLLGIRISRFVVRSRDEVDKALDQALELGIVHIIGGLGLVQKARDRGFKGIILKSGSFESLRNVLREAAFLIALGTRNRQQMELIRCISDLNPNAIVSIDKEYRITYANTQAHQLIGIGERSIVGYLISEFLPSADCTQLLLPEAETTNSSLTTNVSGRRVVMRHFPLQRDGEIEGGVLSLADIADVQREESNIRQKLYAEEHVARMTFDDIIGDSVTMAKVKRQALRFARTEASILLTGETGTGKEMFAQAIHQTSTRSGGAFVSVNCAALPETLLESELFGYEDGTFTGARRGGKIGLFELAHGGTLFLDEIGEMPIQLQTRLLRVLQDKRVMRVGGRRLIPVNVRILSATNRQLADLIAQGSFRDDLFYRINTLVLDIPPLRDRLEDIPRLAEMCIRKNTVKSSARRLSSSALRNLQQRAWRGNVRELVHVLERAMILCEGDDITPELLTADIVPLPRSTTEVPASPPDHFHLDEIERETIKKALVDNRYHKGRTAKALGISRSTLWRKVRELKL
jgi:transcriptional regulator with PAS, ATPase and Fis domain